MSVFENMGQRRFIVNILMERLTKISLQAEGGAPIEFSNEDQSKISCPDNCMVAFCKGSFPPPPPPPAAPENDGGTIDDEDK